MVRVDVRVHGGGGGERVLVRPHGCDGQGGEVADRDGAFGERVVVEVSDRGGVRGREDVLVQAGERGAAVARLRDKGRSLRRRGGIVVRHQVQAGLVSGAQDDGVDVREDGAVQQLDGAGSQEALDAVHGGDAAGAQAGDQRVGDGGLVRDDRGRRMDAPGGVERVDGCGERAHFAVEEPLREAWGEPREQVLDREGAAGEFEIEGDAGVRAGELDGMLADDAVWRVGKRGLSYYVHAFAVREIYFGCVADKAGCSISC